MSIYQFHHCTFPKLEKYLTLGKDAETLWN